MYNSVYVNCPEEANPWKLKVGPWLSGAKGGGKGSGEGAERHRVPFEGDENIQELDSGDSCITLWMY